MFSTVKSRLRPLAKRGAITMGLEGAAILSAMGVAAKARGAGAIFTLHHVRPPSDAPFQPNDILSVTPEFLDTAIGTLTSLGYDLVALADVPRRLESPTGRPFACFTLDDGCRDNAVHAAPVFQRHGVPFTIFITKGFTEATQSMWWQTLDQLIGGNRDLRFDFGSGPETVATATSAEKQAAFDRFSGHINRVDEAEAVAALDTLARSTGIEPLDLTRSLTMRADELMALAANPLCAYGGHTLTHRGLARLPRAQAEAEIAGSMAALAELTGHTPLAFAYPYGDNRSVSPRERDILRALGIRIGVTTRPGVLTPAMAADMTALPRISLNGLYQNARYVRALASGLPFKLMA